MKNVTVGIFSGLTIALIIVFGIVTLYITNTNTLQRYEIKKTAKRNLSMYNNDKKER